MINYLYEDLHNAAYVLSLLHRCLVTASSIINAAAIPSLLRLLKEKGNQIKGQQIYLDFS